MRGVSVRMRKGFTIIELLLSMSFVAILMIIMAILIVNMISIFTRGVTLRDLNSTARLVMDDMTRAIAASPPRTPWPSGADVRTRGYFREVTGTGGRIVAGAFCTGMFSYMWNTFDPDEGDVHDHVTFMLEEGPPSQEWLEERGLLPRPRLMRVMDFERHFCRDDTEMVVELDPGDFIIEGGGHIGAREGMGRPTELLGTSETDLAIIDLQVMRPVRSEVNGQLFYSLSFILGTMVGLDIPDEQGAITATTCRPPADGASEFNYCAINKFSLSMRTTSGSRINHH